MTEKELNQKTVSELRELAKEADMPDYSGAKKAELVEYLANQDEEEIVEDEDVLDDEELPEDEELEESEEETPEDDTTEDKQEESTYDGDVNVAAVNGPRGHEVRRYTLEQHGDNFIGLAYEFAGQYEDYEVVLIDEPSEEEIEAAKGPTIERNSKKPNASIVLDGKRTVRIYTLDQHGKEYDTLANEFITGRDGYTVEPVRITE